MELKELIQNYKSRHQLTNKELGQRFQVSTNTVNRWLRGEVTNIQEETASNISEILGYDIIPLLKGTAITLTQPILGMAKAGYNMFLDDNYLGEEPVSYKDYKKGDYFLKVSGNSMINVGICDGSLVYVKTCRTLQNGQIGVFAVGDEVTIKRFFHEKDGFLLQAENPSIANRFISYAEAQLLPFHILGRVIFSKQYY